MDRQHSISQRARKAASELLGGVAENVLWLSVADPKTPVDEREEAIERLLLEPSPSPHQDAELRAVLGGEMDKLGLEISRIV